VSTVTWDSALLDSEGPTSLVAIARGRRLVLEDSRGPRWVDLCWVDEVALALIDLARSRGQDLTIVYPAPAGQVGVLLAAELLLGEFIAPKGSSSVGLVTADTTMAVRTWNSLRIATTGDRVPIAEVYPCFRAGPEGESPGGGRRLQGVIIGQRSKGWPVDYLVVSHLAGPVQVDTRQAFIEVFADPLDPGIAQAESSGRLIWGWSCANLALGQSLEIAAGQTIPFSVAAERLKTLAHGVEVRLRVASHSAAEAATARVREDLRVLRSMSPGRSDRNLERGLSAAWHHLATLTSLPCRPSRYDHFAGVPPMAARPTSSFAPELSGWAATLSEDFAEIATILASDIADLRAELEHGNPFEETLRDLYAAGEESLVVTRTRTASHALFDLLGLPVTSQRAGPLVVLPIGGLHRLGTWPRAVMVGEPSPWDWHRLLSGLASTVEVLTLGTQSAGECAMAVEAFHGARERWGGDTIRARTWRSLVGSPPPPVPSMPPVAPGPVVVVDGAEYVPEPDPFGALVSLFDLDPLDIGGEGPTSRLAREEDSGSWTAAVPAVEVVTDRGRLVLERGRPVDVRQGPKIVKRRPETLEPGAILLVGRRQGRVGLLEAVEERLRDRPDLMAARFLVDDYRRRVRTRFAESGLTVFALHRILAGLGCNKTSAAVRSWVTDNTMAPQHKDDLERLNEGLELGFSQQQVDELFAGVQRRRGFRRAAGRALAAAALGSTVVVDEDRIDDETGLSIADLREAVVEAVVVAVRPCDHPVPLTLVGRLET
jgi:hypothetical protein